MNLNRSSRSNLASLAAILAVSLLIAGNARVWAAESDAKQEITVEAESLQLDQESQTALFQIDVVATQGTSMTLRAREMQVKYGEAPDSESVANSIELVHAVGDVHIELRGDVIEGEEATYNPVAGFFEARGNVILIRDGNRILGERFIANLTTGESEITGGVRVEFAPGGESGPGASQ